LPRTKNKAKNKPNRLKTGLQGMNTNDMNGNASNSWLGLNWQLGLSTGWGVLGLNVARAMELDGRFKPVPLAQAEPIDCQRSEFEPMVNQMNARVHQVRQMFDAGWPGTLRCEFPVLHSLGNNIHLEGLPKQLEVDSEGSVNYAICVFEYDLSNEFTLENAAKFELVFGGCRWNQEVLKEHGVPNTDLFLHGVDSGLFYPRRKKNQNRFIVFSGGKLEYRKGQDIVVAAFRQFAKRHADAVLATVWNNPWIDSAESIALGGHVDEELGVDENGCLRIEEWAIRNGISPSQIVDFGTVPNESMPELYSQASVAVFASRCEGGTNMMAMEAMASGVPCILSANTGHLDLMTEDNCYPLLEQTQLTTQNLTGKEDWRESNVDELVEALERVYQDRDEANMRSAQGAKFMGDWTWEKRTEPLIERIHQTIQNR
jgi:glycosyltransferase involved in cell wall biosynthesis